MISASLSHYSVTGSLLGVLQTLHSVKSYKISGSGAVNVEGEWDHISSNLGQTTVFPLTDLDNSGKICMVLIISPGWKACDLNDLAHVSRAGSVLHRSCITSHDHRHRIYCR